jgi:hypothetical protein
MKSRAVSRLLRLTRYASNGCEDIGRPRGRTTTTRVGDDPLLEAGFEAERVRPEAFRAGGLTSAGQLGGRSPIQQRGPGGSAQ